ncbi:hypothetical protein MMAD_35760 [Mycolicibacterium madagascariense]|uniref:Uncharacterized protein n=1 Tax=Mycolicibacterium madagascariense TaxID=212765 RepID=A0A7I7XJA9_9MYCO|nr:hypothetical protein MMAD_35760 [Mycolicibacterium madagascariense]
MKPLGRQSDYEPPRESFVAVYVDRSATPDVVRAAAACVPLPSGIECATVDDTLFTETFDCRVVVYLVGDFEPAAGPPLARRYAAELSGILGCPAYALNDLLRVDPPPE